jgi:hypothetical protein
MFAYRLLVAEIVMLWMWSPRLAIQGTARRLCKNRPRSPARPTVCVEQLLHVQHYADVLGNAAALCLDISPELREVVPSGDNLPSPVLKQDQRRSPEFTADAIDETARAGNDISDPIVCSAVATPGSSDRDLSFLVPNLAERTGQRWPFGSGGVLMRQVWLVFGDS